MINDAFGEHIRAGYTVGGGVSTGHIRHYFDPANLGNYPGPLKASGLYFSQGIVWDKQHPVLTRKDGMGRRVERVTFRWRRGRVV